MKILVVDDDTAIREMLKGFLVSRGYEVTLCHNGSLGLAAFEKDYHPLIISDVMMPNMNGYEFCRRIRGLPQGDRCVILVMTAHDSSEVLENVLDAGADDYITRSLDFQLLTVRLRIAEQRLRIRLKQRDSDEQIQRQIEELSQVNARLTAEITERKRIEASLKEHEKELELQNVELNETQQKLSLAYQNYRDLYDFAPIGYFTFDKNGLILELNLTGSYLIGCDRENAFRKSFTSFVDSDSRVDFYRHRQQLFQNQTRQTCELKLVKQDGNKVYIRLESIIAKDGKGELNRIRSAVLDITDRKQAEVELERYQLYLEELVAERTAESTKKNQQLQQEIAERKQVEAELRKYKNNLEVLVQNRTADLRESERKYRDLIETIEEGIGMVDDKENFIFVNRALAAIFGYSEKELIGKNLKNLTIPQQFEQIIEQTAIWKTGKSSRYELQIIRKDKTLKTLMILASPTIDNGTYKGAFGIYTDITDRKVMEEELKKAKEMAEIANQAKSEFLANMSHELRTPLNAILGYSQILLGDKTLSEKQRDTIAIIQKSGNNLLMLINDILDLSKIESKRLMLSPGEFNFINFITNIVNIAQERAEQKDISFRYETFSALPEYVHADEQRLFQILLNLISNAVKYTERGEIVFRVGYIPTTEKESRMLRFEIEDTGLGIPEDKLDDIFNLFHHVNAGLGLAISQRLVQMMGGQLLVESVVDEGSRFWFDLDLTEVSLSSQKLVFDSNKIIGFEGDSRKILIVDDRMENVILLQEMLSPLGFEIKEVTDSRNALKVVDEFQPELILMDLIMPHLDGFEITRQIRQRSELNHIMIVAVSANAYGNIHQKNSDVGFNDFVVKPIQYHVLLKIIGRHLQIKWIYESPSSSIQPPATSKFIIPYNEALRHFYDLVDSGDVMNVLEWLDQLEEEDVKYIPFVEKFRRLTKNFQLKQICALVEEYIGDE